MLFTKLQRFNPARFSPVRHANTLHNELEALFQQVWSANSTAESEADSSYLSVGSLPPLNVYEDANGLSVILELPGTRKEDIQLKLEDSVLTIAGERKQSSQAENASFNRRERVSGRFERRVTLPYAVNAEAIKASYIDGVLTVTLPKAEEAKPKNIPVEIN